MDTTTITLDASDLVYGDHLLRLALVLSALTGKSFELTNFHDGISGADGLKREHLRIIEWFAAVCGAQVSGAQAYGNALTFRPHASTDGAVQHEPLPEPLELGAPGNVCLVIEAILPYLIFAGALHPAGDADTPELRKVTIHGGQIIGGYPSLEYWQHVLLPTLQRIGLPRISIDVHERGWNSQISSTTLTVECMPVDAELMAWSLDNRGLIERIEVHGLVPTALKQAFEQELSHAIGTDFKGVQIEWHIEDNEHTCYLLLVAITANGHRIGRDYTYQGALNHKTHKIPADVVGTVMSYLKEERKNGGCVDALMRHQLVIYQALASGRCYVDLGANPNGAYSSNIFAETAQELTSKMLGVSWSKKLTCEGIGFVVGQTVPDA